MLIPMGIFPSRGKGGKGGSLYMHCGVQPHTQKGGDTLGHHRTMVAVLDTCVGS